MLINQLKGEPQMKKFLYSIPLITVLIAPTCFASDSEENENIEVLRVRTEPSQIYGIKTHYRHLVDSRGKDYIPYVLPSSPTIKQDVNRRLTTPSSPNRKIKMQRK